ncbi:hypothetical protein [Streptomyces sp. cg35]|uniref:hypothetical protein n=1 Tax=Streptomyces sp. cg35 TaxID=3421650 RepID=UPI003D16773B
MIRTAAAVAAVMCASVITTASPAAADSSACTHHFSGPQVCIRLVGHNGGNSATGFWSNPPKSVKSRAVYLTLNGHNYGSPSTAKRVGKTISYTWSSFDMDTDTKVCVRFKGINRIACQATKYKGVPGPV